MRRVPAILLVFVFSFSLIAPALFADGESNLPACCRRNGSHHCGMMAQDMAETPPSGPAADAFRVKCPFFPTGGATVPECEPALVARSQTAGVAVSSQIADRGEAEVGYRISLKDSHQKRGPPSLLS
jgi:hypothetical protein